MEFKKEAVDMNIEIKHMPEKAGNFSDSSNDRSEGNTSDSDSQKTEYVDVLVHDGSIDRKKFARKTFTMQKYSCNGMTSVSLECLEAIEELVAMDRAENGKLTYENMKKLMIEKEVVSDQQRKDTVQTRKRLR
eukprot:CAMPEP_0198141100 /NCGR_PEP_ID=MMETSP1443-20131203/4171_1 /TAXON_ID=186043 /ORGANISM="Entomoneis sp., Strain CCMP2396" /LENGTH=132 /DNA_ID=CAMNT_0043803737 /DNA_START=453 /DNA_END=847 /DNA_ORIENTATION=-